MGAEISLHDPYAKHWWELEKQDSFPVLGNSRVSCFRNQTKLADTKIQKNISETLKGVDAVVLAVRHQIYLKLEPEKIIKMTGRPVAIIDCFGILDGEKIKRFFELGCEVKGLGRGRVKRIKDSVNNKQTSR